MKKTLVVKKSWCKKCGICVEFCPVKILELKEDSIDVTNPNKCIGCGQCEQRCPDYAIYLKKSE